MTHYQLEGTCYFELLPGKHRRKCWNDGSLFLSEETWGYVEPTVQEIVPEYDHYSFLDVPREQWHAIVTRFRELIPLARAARNTKELPEGIGFLVHASKDEFEKDFETNRDSLVDLLGELSDWLERQLKTNRFIAVLGI